MLTPKRSNNSTASNQRIEVLFSSTEPRCLRCGYFFLSRSCSCLAKKLIPQIIICVHGRYTVLNAKHFLRVYPFRWVPILSEHGFDFCSLVWNRGGGVLPYICYTGMCRWRGYGFQAIWSGKGYGFQVIWSGRGYGFQAIWSSTGSRLTGSLTKDWNQE